MTEIELENQLYVTMKALRFFSFTHPASVGVWQYPSLLYTF